MIAATICYSREEQLAFEHESAGALGGSMNETSRDSASLWGASWDLRTEALAARQAPL